MLNLVSGANGVPLQVVERFAMFLQLKRALNTLRLSEETRVLCQPLAQKTGQKCDTKPLGKGLFFQAVDKCAHNALLDKLGYTATAT